MLSNHKLQVTLGEIKEISRVDFALYSDKGKLLASTYQIEEDMEEAIQLFADSMAESQMLSGCHFFKVMIEGELEYILLAHAGGEEAYMVGRLAVCQIRNMVSAYQEQFDRNSFMQNVVLGNMLVVDMYNKAKKLHIEAAERVVFVIEVSGEKDGAVMETIRNLFAASPRDFVTEVDEKSVILVKDVRDISSDEELEKLAKMLVDNLQAEALVKIRAGYGNRVELLPDIARSYQEARMALEVGRIFYVENQTISYSRLGIGRLIYQIPANLCEMFLREVFGGKIPDIFDEETTVTINKFFENNLNISETARQLYVHRNTLVYRLERIQRILGLDIRTFEDAMLFKIALMVIAHMNYQKSLIMRHKKEENEKRKDI
ncbi:PucR family transcriptional regulator [Lachnospiraceae bacterium]|nr:PucR family transcriptional regulator [Lachnospiraceae bacterium]